MVAQGASQYTIVAIIGDVRHDGPRSVVEPEYNLDVRFSGVAALTRPYVVVRGERATTDVVDAVRRILRDVAPGAGLGGTATSLEAWVARVLAVPRFNAFLLSVFALVGVILATMALYGLSAFAVTQTREIGIRAALGARRGQLVSLVLRRSLPVTVGGLGVGAAFGMGLSRFAQSLLFGVSSLDPTGVLLVVLSFGAVSSLAMYAPARRGAAIDPAVTLRAG